MRLGLIFALIMYISLPVMAYKIVPDQVLVTEENLKDIDLFFAMQGYDIYANRPELFFMPEIDRLYFKSRTNEKIFLKISAFLENKDFKKSVQIKNGHLMNFSFQSTSSVMYFSGIDHATSDKIKKNLKKELANKSVWAYLMLPSAQAEVAVCNNKILQNNDDSKIVKNGVIRGTWGCIKGIGSTAWNFTGGMIHDLAKLGWNVGRNSSILLYCSLPIQKTETSCAEWQDEIFSAAEKNFTEISGMIQNTNQILKQLYPAFSQLDSEKQGAIACEVISTIGVSTALMIGTGGIGTSSAAIKIHQVVEKLKGTSLKVPKNFEAKIDRNSIPNVANQLNKLDSAKAKELFDSYKAYMVQFRQTVNSQITHVELKNELERFNELAKRVKKNPALLKTLDPEEKEFLTGTLKYNRELVDRVKTAGDMYIREKIARDKLLAKAHSKMYEAEKWVDQSKLSGAEKAVVKAELAALNCAMLDQSIETLTKPSSRSEPQSRSAN